MNEEWGTPVACPKLSTRLGYHVPPYLVLVWMLVDLPGCATNPMISNVRSRTFLCSISCAKSHNLVLADSDGLKMVIEPDVSNLAPTPNVDVISWRATARTHGFA
ncbi:hypothetical protein BS47DRAFT_1351020 [Hydnum rufescens UP504]|uniref:Uncharacterized protein n=1 Tax=Hydnum rufescens UP504 TaxID=1448309 RepID=A0A9P6ALF2_9AGAM|nr:hypothetical protein BS47DRAFT_1351020 [Hydnum rufescens UP504]